MSPAAWPREDPAHTRLLHLDPRRGAYTDRRIGELVRLVSRGDLVVVNDAATLPASLRGQTESGAAIELRLAGPLLGARARTIVFGPGDWRERTEDRAPPPVLGVGDRIVLGGRGELGCVVSSVDPQSARLVEIEFDEEGDDLYRAMYRLGRPVQYAYTERPLQLWHVQTAYAARPWAVEAPSAGLGLSWSLLVELRRRGVKIVPLTHAAGLSSTGDPALDARLPLAERYRIPTATVAAVDATRAAVGRVLVIGTTVVRALEGCAAEHGRLQAGEGETTLRLGPGAELRLVDGLLTGMHEAGTSHYSLLEAFAPRALLDETHAHAASQGYEAHEFGDTLLLW